MDDEVKQLMRDEFLRRHSRGPRSHEEIIGFVHWMESNQVPVDLSKLLWFLVGWMNEETTAVQSARKRRLL
jgi:hypothetical protein